MQYTSSRIRSSVVALALTATFLAGCGGGSHGGGSLPAAVPTNAPGTGTTAVGSAPATFTFTFPKDTTTANARAALGTRAPRYLSSATKSITVQVTDTKSAATGNADIYANVPAALKAVQSVNFANLTGNGSVAGQCGTDPSNAGNFKCTAVFQMPIGIDTTTIASWDANGGIGNKLSQNIANFTISQGVLNTPSVSLDANAATISLSGTQPCTAGSIQGVFGSGQGTSPVTINVSFTDPAGKTIVAPGLPIIQIEDNTSTFKSTSGTINATGGTVAFSINQSTQSFTLTPSTVPISNASVIVHGVPPNTTGSSDGLGFTQSHTFTFSSGTAPPAHNFLAVIEQSGVPNTGQIDFYNVSLGGSGGPDSITAFSTPSLATTNSISTPSEPDVDNPLDLIWDSGSNLLIANGGQGGAGGDFGNFACVPAGAITTGANLATTNTTNMDVPTAIALASDGTVAIANNPAGAAKNVEEFTLSTNYVPGASLTNPGSFGVPVNRPLVNLPTLTTGTFAVGLFDGTNSKVDILAESGSIGTITNAGDTNLNDPSGMAWDSANNQLVVATNNGCNPPASTSSFLEFYTVGNAPTAPTKVGGFMIQQNPNGGNPYSAMIGQHVAAAPNGTLAVSGVNCDNSASGLPEVQIYSSNATPGSRTATGTIPFDTLKSADVSGCNDFTTGDYTYGLSDIVEDIKWLSNTKLLILLLSNNSAKQGIYIYDISATASPGGFWCSGAAPTGPKQTSFTNLSSLAPHSAAFKP